jgi:hypothetical protein
MDGDRVRPDEAGLGDELVARPGGLMFLVGRTSVVDPRPRHKDIEHKGEQDQGAEGRDDLNCHGRLTYLTTAPLVADCFKRLSWARGVR